MKTHSTNKEYEGPRMKGIYEQYNRSCHFFRLAQRCKRPESKFRNLIAAIYPARAIVELMLEAAAMKEIDAFQEENDDDNKEALRRILEPKLPHYQLVYKIRIHDFHRFGCLPLPLVVIGK